MEDDYLELYLDYSDMLQEARDENTKLRKLIIQMYKYIKWKDMTSDSMFSVAHSYEKDMRELGIEVDG